MITITSTTDDIYEYVKRCKTWQVGAINSALSDVVTAQANGIYNDSTTIRTALDRYEQAFPFPKFLPLV